MGLYHVVTMLTVGDWDFWDGGNRDAGGDPFYLLGVLPFATTFLTLSLVATEWINRVLNMHGWAYYPLNFIWPATLIPCGLALDTTLVLTESILLAGIVGGFLWGVLFYLANWPLMAPFLAPVNLQGALMSIADLQGFHYIRTGTPEYIRIINRGTLRTFGQDPVYLSVAFAGFMSIVVYMVFVGVGWLFVKNQFSWLKKI